MVDVLVLGVATGLGGNAASAVAAAEGAATSHGGGGGHKDSREGWGATEGRADADDGTATGRRDSRVDRMRTEGEGRHRRGKITRGAVAVVAAERENWATTNQRYIINMV